MRAVDIYSKLLILKLQTFMLTNSPYGFADAGMQYMLRGALPPEIKHWTEVSAEKKMDAGVRGRGNEGEGTERVEEGRGER